MAAVGNEVLYREEMSEAELIACIDRVRNALPDVPVGYVDAYYEFADRPKLFEACDAILANCYPYWEGCHMDYSLLYMKQMYYQVKQAEPDENHHHRDGRRVGRGVGCSGARLRKRAEAHQCTKWTQAEGIEMFYFSAFDEAWKVDAEGSGRLLGALGQGRGAEVLRADP